MLVKASSWMTLVALVLPFAPGPVGATDVDGGNDCQRPTNDFGDAPEGFDAYPGVIGHFPTCTAPSLPGTQEISCPPISTPPGPTGYVLHRNTDPGTGYWLGCGPVGTPPSGIDSEPDGKTSFAAATSFCSQIPVDCMEVASYGTFGQDECFGGSDAGLTDRPDLRTCAPATIKFQTMNCATDREVYLNVLLDMNADGDWNDNFECADGCAYEWALKNVLITIPAACGTQESPPFLVGPNAGHAWMRISVSDNPVGDDFPWDGSEHFQEGFLFRGETEDYPLEIADGGGDPCEVGYQDFGDAPEGIVAYSSGVIGQFPTCTTAAGIGTQEIDAGCAPVSTLPGPTGFVRHVQLPVDPNGLWFGCGGPGPAWVDSEPDGKVNSTPPAGTPSSCNNITPTDCLETTSAGLVFGQDECAGDGVDAGLAAATNPVFDACETTQIRFRTFNCSSQPVTAFVNLLFDWNEDGDWNDVLSCDDACVPEWAVHNVSVVIPPGCSIWTSPVFQVGPKPGFGWMRATITHTPVPADFPWNGSVSLPSNAFQGGETEDYPIEIRSDVTGVGTIDVPEDGLWLSRGTPSPATSATELRFGITQTGPVKVTVYDVAGRRVRTLIDGTRGPGAHVATWDLRNERGEAVAPGIYLVRLEAEGAARTSRITRVR